MLALKTKKFRAIYFLLKSQSIHLLVGWPMLPNVLISRTASNICSARRCGFCKGKPLSFWRRSSFVADTKASLCTFKPTQEASRDFCKCCGNQLFFRLTRWPGEVHGWTLISSCWDMAGSRASYRLRIKKHFGQNSAFHTISLYPENRTM